MISPAPTVVRIKQGQTLRRLRQCPASVSLRDWELGEWGLLFLLFLYDNITDTN